MHAGGAPAQTWRGAAHAPEGARVEAGVVGQHGGQRVLEHQQPSVGLLLHGQQQPDAAVQRGCRGHRGEPADLTRRPRPPPALALTEPRDVLVLPHDRLLAGPLGSPPARGPPEGVHVGSHVEVCPAQQAHAPEALLGWARGTSGHGPSSPARAQQKGRGDTYLLADTCTPSGCGHGQTLGTKPRVSPGYSQGLRDSGLQALHLPRKPSWALSTMKSTLYTSRGLAS